MSLDATGYPQGRVGHTSRHPPVAPDGVNPCQALYYFSLYVAFYLTRVLAMGQTLCVRQSPKCQAQTVGKV